MLIAVHTTTFLTELAPFARLLREHTDAEPIFYCTFAHPTANAFAEKCAAESIPCLLDPLPDSLDRLFPQHGGDAPSAPSHARMPRAAMAAARRTAAALPGLGANFQQEYQGFIRRGAEIRALLSHLGPALLVLGGDMAGYDTALFIKLAREIGIATVIIPSTMSNGREQAEVYFDNPDHQVLGWTGELVARLFPKWVRRHKGRRLFRCPPGRILAMELAGLAPPQPWIFNSGDAAAVAMESEAMIDYYVEAGMSRERMVLTGTMSDDDMAERLRASGTQRDRLCRELGLTPEMPIILTALPPDFLYIPGGRPLCDFRTYDELVEFWIETLAELKGCNRIVALHPSVDIQSMLHIERAGIRIGRWNTASMVPCCDIYVASISSTIRWAIACGKPVVNYDVYRYRYTDFLGVPGVLAMEEQSAFRATLGRLATDEAYRQELAQAQRTTGDRWGRLDGRAGERMLALVERLSGITTRARAKGFLPERSATH